MLAARRERIQQVVAAELRSAHAGVRAAGEQSPLLAEAAANARTAVSLIRRRYEAGTALLLEVLQAQDALQNVEASQVENAIALSVARLALQAATGEL